MPATAVNAKSVVFGDFSRYFVRLVGGVGSSGDEYAFNADLITYRALLRGDGALMDTTGAVKSQQTEEKRRWLQARRVWRHAPPL
jgi:HK97 family phage major capsid protein